ncbi:MAG: deoxyribose-phosphate aldolase [Bacteroidales bacterium]|nr:deoxyribose-phosphate aldolase [Bacteroidales bacterium]MDD3989282.1 deoxyribose-phosphate aldolase [Bacteroidales bacterium]MDD4638585.1 deoxyribose-phosphate aldolase [Bacteroidales bacterium]
MHSVNNEIRAIKNRLGSYLTKEVFRNILSCIDLTTLSPLDTPSSIIKMAAKVNNFHKEFPTLPNVASICTYPNFSPLLKEYLKAPGVKITAVAGCFPASQSFEEIKAAECGMAVEKGAGEIDIVLPLSKFLDKDYDSVKRELHLLREATKGVTLKVIIESGILESSELIGMASDFAMECGADFVKTSTGKIEPAATPEAAYTICCRIRERYQKDGIKTGFKPAGGISTPEQAAFYYAIVDSVLGKEWLTPSLFRIGASRLANNLLSALTGSQISYF